MGKVSFKAAIEAAETKQKNSQGKSIQYFRVTDKPTTIRFDTTSDEPLLKFGQHYVKFNNGWNKAYSCPDFEKLDGERTCVICKAKKGVDVEKNDFSTNFVMRIIERDAVIEDKVEDDNGNLVTKVDSDGNPVTHTEDVVKYYKFSPFVMTYITAIFNETEDVGDRDYEVSSSKQMNEKGQERTVYLFEPVTNKPKALSSADKALLADAPDLSVAEPAYDPEHFEATKIKQVSAKKGAASAPLSEDTLSSFFKPKNEEPSKLGDISSLITGSKPKASSNDDDDDDDDINMASYLKGLKK